MRLTAVALLLAALPATAADWPQWRGPNRDGKSADTGLAATWPAGGPKLLWKLDNVGTGYGQVAVVGEKVYLIGADGKKAGAGEFVLCLSATDGKELWRTPLRTAEAKFLDGWGGGPRATPTVMNNKVYALGASGDLVCLDASGGGLIWKKNLVSDFGGGIPQWGYSESPLVDGGNVIVTPGNKTGMVALKADTGEVAWKCEELHDGAGYSGIIPADVGGVRVYIQQTNSHPAGGGAGGKGAKGGKGDAGKAVGVRAKDGKLLFVVGELARTVAVIPTPVVVGDLAFFTSGYGAGCELFKLAPDGQGGVTATKVYTKNMVLPNHHGGVIEHEGYIYGHSDGRGGLNKYVCFDYKKGPDEPEWAEPGPGKGSITYADGHFYLYGEANGTLVRIKATKDGYQEVGKFTIPAKSAERKGTQGAIWPHPVVANGKLYLRDYELLFVYDLGGKVATK